MIPFALLGCIIDGEEYSMMDCSVDGFTIRRAIFRGMLEQNAQMKSDDQDVHFARPSEICVFGYNEENGAYEHVIISKAEIVEVREIGSKTPLVGAEDVQDIGECMDECMGETLISGERFQVFEFRIESRTYQKLVMDVMGRFTKAIYRERAISSGRTDEVCALAQSGDIEGNQVVHTSEISIYPARIPTEWLRSVDVGLVLHDRHEWEYFLNEDLASFVSWYEQRWGIDETVIGMSPLRDRLRMIYIGNEFCHLQFPSKPVLCSIMDRVESLGLVPVLVTSHLPIRESQLMERRLSWLYERAECRGTSYEVVVNDLGTALMLQKLEADHDIHRLIPTLGHLLQKQKRDMREMRETFSKDNTLRITGAGAYPVQTTLWRHLRIQRIECDVPWLVDKVRGIDLNADCDSFTNDLGMIDEKGCGAELKAARKMGYSLHIPFFQMNTSTQCVLRAMIQHGSRSAGPACGVGKCMEACLQYGQHFPEEAGGMVGLYNSIFGKAQVIFDTQHPHQPESESCTAKREHDRNRHRSEPGSVRWSSALMDVDRLIIGL